jgi:hypothetical protein
MICYWLMLNKEYEVGDTVQTTRQNDDGAKMKSVNIY